jgi:hypothetical protein
LEMPIPQPPSSGIVRLLASSERVFERVDDSSGHVQAIFHDAASALPALAQQMSVEDKSRLLDRLLPLLLADSYGLIQTVLHDTIPLLPVPELKRIDAVLKASLQKIGADDDTRDWDRRIRRDRVIRARQAVADHAGDVDAFIALEQERSAAAPDTKGVAERLLAAGRASEALDWVRRPGRPGLCVMSWHDSADPTTGEGLFARQRVQLEIRILMRLGERDAAQRLRWQAFEATLGHDMLREFIAHLPEFGEFEALDRAFAHAAAHPQRYRAVAFFLAWPRLDLAAKLILEHQAAWDGRHYGALVPAAEALEHDHPLAATVLYRALIDSILGQARSPAYGHAARYLTKLDQLSTGIEGASFGLSDHDAYRAALRKTHGRKLGFWSIIDAT